MEYEAIEPGAHFNSAPIPPASPGHYAASCLPAFTIRTARWRQQSCNEMECACIWRATASKEVICWWAPMARDRSSGTRSSSLACIRRMQARVHLGLRIHGLSSALEGAIEH